MSDLLKNIKRYEPLWGAWRVETLIGEGAYGDVYKISRKESGATVYATAKIVSIPHDKSVIQHLRQGGYDDNAIHDIFRNLVTNITIEASHLNEFRGNSNIVTYDDITVIDKSDPSLYHPTSNFTPPASQLGWDILFRMELMTNLNDHIKKKPLSNLEILKLGIHICHALELNNQKNDVHMDIKPENIFVSPEGDYKLADFAIARQIERVMSGYAKKDPSAYMAPEVLKGNPWDHTVDTYALGMVMYKLLNHNRDPFLPETALTTTSEQRASSLQRRLNGEPLPALNKISPDLNALVLKACAYNPQDRFASPAEMRKTLEAIHENIAFAPDPGAFPKHVVPSKKPDVVSPNQRKSLFKKPAIFAAGLLAIGVIIGGYVIALDKTHSTDNSLTSAIAATDSSGSAKPADENKTDQNNTTDQNNATDQDNATDETTTDPIVTEDEMALETKPPTGASHLTGTDTTAPSTGTGTGTTTTGTTTGTTNTASVERTYSDQGITNAQLAEMVRNGTIPQNTTSLCLANNSITDISPLRSLTNLQTLCLEDNSTLSDLTPLRSLTNLRELYLSGIKVSDLTPLHSLTKLTTLSLEDNHTSLSSSKKKALQNALPNCQIYF
ncbi:MAG: protein kinase [Gracilibacteraceae bacterium]|jgi:serine/threonine protein kinase|nr:protein kinase [Gracilibacteraceae bacterium]